jgi:hypothetical protein
VRVHLASPRGGSVSQDWRKPLGSEKSRTYLDCLQTLETSYAMFSVNLDEALEMRRRGRVDMAREVLNVAPALCRRLATPLHSLLSAMLEHSRHFGTMPNILPLDAENFQNPSSQRTARISDLFSKILLTRKSQFLHKMWILSELVDNLSTSFEEKVRELRDEDSLCPERDWEKLDAMHYDLNTCLRQTVVLFKSFLHALPEGQLSYFEASLDARIVAASAERALRVVEDRNLTHGRMAFLKGQ